MDKVEISTYYLFSEHETTPFKYVHPLKLNKVKQLSEMEFPSYVKYLILFGSSLDLSCTQASDIDLYFIVDEGYEYCSDTIIELHKLCSNVQSRFDLLVSNEKEFFESSMNVNSVQRKILERGAIIYERKKEFEDNSA
ncbi:MAG: hypothetical protein LBU32_23935 [Clostridiales bacterium]|jgi:predicted nucleotidyltransferase|nr:hypothetical protein [Clostridiales bacterium]